MILSHFVFNTLDARVAHPSAVGRVLRVHGARRPVRAEADRQSGVRSRPTAAQLRAAGHVATGRVPGERAGATLRARTANAATGDVRLPRIARTIGLDVRYARSIISQYT